MICLISLVSLFVASAAFISYDRYAYKEKMVHELTILSRIIASRSSAAVAYTDSYQVRQNLDTLGANNTIFSACVTNELGELVAMWSRDVAQPIEQSGEPIAGVTCLARQNFISRFSSDYLDILQPILWEETQRIGELHIRVELTDLDKRFKVFSVVLFMIVLLATLVAILLSSKIQRFISEPLLGLTRIADQITSQKDYSVRAETDRHDELGQLVHAFNAMLETIQQQNKALVEINENLESEVDARTAELKLTNKELEAFTYSVSHDLRSPLRSVDGFSAALLEDCASQLDQQGLDYLTRMRAASQRMGKLIDSLLYLSRVSRQDMVSKAVDLADIAREIADGLRIVHPNRDVELLAPDCLMAHGDKDLLYIVIDNLLRNAWKYTGKKTHAVIELGSEERQGETVYFVRDNGAGFDMKYADKLFGPFQRLHRSDEFEGLGIGLATVARIVHRHGGEIWAEGEVDAGAVFYFTLGSIRNEKNT